MATLALKAPVRRDVALLVTDLEAFTSFADVTEPEYVFARLAEYHEVVGRNVEEHGGEVFDIAGDTVLAMFNGRIEATEPARRAAEAGVAVHREARLLIDRWRKQGDSLELTIALNAGFVTLGQVRAGSFERHAAVGSMVYATFHIGRAARPGEMLASARVAHEAGHVAEVIPRPEIAISQVPRLQVFELRPRP